MAKAPVTPVKTPAKAPAKANTTTLAGIIAASDKNAPSNARAVAQIADQKATAAKTVVAKTVVKAAPAGTTNIADKATKSVTKAPTPTESQILQYREDVKDAAKAKADQSNPWMFLSNVTGNSANREKTNTAEMKAFEAKYGKVDAKGTPYTKTKTTTTSVIGARTKEQLTVLQNDNSGLMQAGRIGAYLTPGLGTATGLGNALGSAQRGDVGGALTHTALAFAPGIVGAGVKAAGRVGTQAVNVAAKVAPKTTAKVVATTTKASNAVSQTAAKVGAKVNTKIVQPINSKVTSLISDPVPVVSAAQKVITDSSKTIKSTTKAANQLVGQEAKAAKSGKSVVAEAEAILKNPDKLGGTGGRTSGYSGPTKPPTGGTGGGGVGSSPRFTPKPGGPGGAGKQQTVARQVFDQSTGNYRTISQPVTGGGRVGSSSGAPASMSAGLPARATSRQANGGLTVGGQGTVVLDRPAVDFTSTKLADRVIANPGVGTQFKGPTITRPSTRPATRPSGPSTRPPSRTDKPGPTQPTRPGQKPAERPATPTVPKTVPAAPKPGTPNPVKPGQPLPTSPVVPKTNPAKEPQIPARTPEQVPGKVPTVTPGRTPSQVPAVKPVTSPVRKPVEPVAPWKPRTEPIKPAKPMVPAPKRTPAVKPAIGAPAKSPFPTKTEKEWPGTGNSNKYKDELGWKPALGPGAETAPGPGGSTETPPPTPPVPPKNPPVPPRSPKLPRIIPASERDALLGPIQSNWSDYRQNYNSRVNTSTAVDPLHEQEAMASAAETGKAYAPRRRAAAFTEARTSFTVVP